jgi:hypothetical protein
MQHVQVRWAELEDAVVSLGVGHGRHDRGFYGLGPHGSGASGTTPPGARGKAQELGLAMLRPSNE